MSWARLDDKANEHRKQLRAGPEACWMWACGLMFANRQRERDGFIPDQALAILYPFKSNPKTLATKLVEVGLWEKVDGGYQIHDFDHWNQSREETESERAAARERMRAVRNDPGLYLRIKERDRSECRYCGIEVDWKDRRGHGAGSYDHVLPLSQGGQTTEENVVVACRKCNRLKSYKTPEQAGLVLRPVPRSVPRNVLETSGSTPTPLQIQETTTTQGPETPNARARSGPGVVVAVAPISERARKVLENPYDGQFQRPSKWPEVSRVAAAWSFGMRLRLRDTVSNDSDLRTILEALSDGYSVEELELAGERAKTSEHFAKLKRKAPAAFTAAVLRTLLANEPVPPKTTPDPFEDTGAFERFMADGASR